MSNFTTHKVDSSGAVRLQFTNDSNRILFSISPDNKVTLHGTDISLDEASQLFWEAVERKAPSASWRPADATTDDDGQLARVTVEIVSGYMLLADKTPVVRLIINGVDIGITLPANGGIHQTIEKALKTTN